MKELTKLMTLGNGKGQSVTADEVSDSNMTKLSTLILNYITV
jgi:hypothetical protein